MLARLAVLAAVVLLVTAAPAAADTACDPMQTPPEFQGGVPKLETVVPAPGGENGEVTTDQAYSYMDAVDAASDRVITGALEKKSWQDRELRWAMIGHPDHLDRRSLKAIAKAAQALRNPKTPPWLARQIAKRFPAILWIASNVHGGEESGTDASMRVLYELADRTDCAARQILDNSIVVLLPTQNPDGRELNTRQNFYGFDMNRDWFARTQPETDGKLELLRQYPGPLFVDDHEMGADHLLLPAQRRPDLPRDHRRVGRLDQQHLRGVARERVQPPGHPLLQPRHLRPLLHGLRRHRARDRLHLRRNDLREEQRRANRQARIRAVRGAVGEPVSRRDPQARDPGRLGVGVARGLSAGSGRLPRAKRDRQSGQRGGDPGPDRAAAPLLHHRAPRLEAARGQGDDPAPPAHGRRRLPPGQAHLGAGLHTLRPVHARPVDGSRHLVRADGPDAEALGAGDAERGHLHAVPLLLRRDGVEPAAAVQRARRLLRRAAAAQGPRRGRARRPGCAGGAGRRSEDRRVPALGDLHVGDRVDRLAALSA